MEETSPCFVSAESSANPFHSENAECSPHGESSESHVKENREIPDGKGKSPDCEMVSGSDGIGEGFARDCAVGFFSDIGSVKAEVLKTAEDVKESSLFSELVDKEEKVTLKSQVGVMGIQEFEDSEEGLAVSKKLPAIQADSEKGLAVPSFSLHEKQFLGNSVVEAESSLEVKKKHLLEELEALIMPGDKINAKEVNDSKRSGGELGNSTTIVGSDEKMSDRQEVHKPVNNDAEDVHALKGIDWSARCSFEIEVIDETALIEPVFFPITGYGGGKKNDFSIPGKHTKRQGNNLAEGMHEKKVKRSRRKAKGMKKVQEMGGKNIGITQMTEAHNGRPKNGEGAKTQYNREELEALRFVNIVEQRKMWKDIYVGLGPAVSKEYDDLASYKHQNDPASSKHQKHIVLNFEPTKRSVKKERLPSILGEECTEKTDIEVGNLIENETEDLNPSDAACWYGAVDEGGNAAQGEYSDDYDSDEDYASIQRPAFFVEGEPNFESGSPEDGLEYLRRVRWEAAQVPKVSVAKFERSKCSKDQTVYLPNIPEIAKCPEHLLPLKQWEDAFLAEFSELRLAMSRLESSSTVGKSHSPMLPGGVKIKTKEVEPYPPRDCCRLDNSYNQPSSLTGEENNTKQLPENLISKSSTNESSSNYPLLSVILGMDSVARLSMLRKRIKSLEDASTLSKNDGLWLFALCAVVDTPLDADSCASIRNLLRKCASLRAGKSELDDEVIMLSILVTISRRYFGQAEAEGS
ncbi:uncharacterized protein LOC107422117 [Ziziphus jujuba]|uniref:Uncharacterized protein LOC107422117 n=1 Tax=Ziziphus jujuba TaxID=326968 RepID=A0ABM4A580_ZIZJJ|nr:uncharacterized protein LOC107422117 [Ziziphus jujuba var. spinosa]XP_060671890.1 uncharacterized protein LOC107422117 [Ziziphus jujuba]